MKVDGRCHCGFITYEAEIDPEKVVICNCVDCQRLSGSPFRTVAFSVENGFKLLSGELKVYLKTGGSGNKRQQAFCPECGSSIYATSEEGGPLYGIRTGSINQAAELVPKVRIFTRSEWPWVDDIASLPKIEGAPSG